MARLHGIHRVRQRRQRLENQFSHVGVDNFPESTTLSPELVSQYARYLCVLVAGFVEQSVGDLLVECARRRSDDSVSSFVESRLDRLPNMKQERLRQLLRSFNVAWWDDLQSRCPDQLQSLDSVVALRNQIAHGKDTGTSYVGVLQYFNDASDVLESLASVLEIEDPGK